MAHSHAAPGDLTRNQGLVLGTLTGSSGPLSAYDILDKLRADGLRAPLQVYRALDKLVERGLAHRLESLNAFVACADEHCHRKGLIAFAICSDCGKVNEFADAVIEERLGNWAGDQGFKVERKTMEIRGKCAQCAVVA
ncbi:Fur family transcriptional regulator [Devosia neptuniae]|jgi:Fur family zinc uptake transcriptional regulator|uniref:Fur family transcriptional regulator n=1 Tax=Devosia TaxID=46913 RepID=UPI0022B0262A|nr:Fur family transcriptional regulator [Devosia neptuniae]MCZ4344581.1 Fur family transcriptional regulator [Devosia neptuniae]|tara:strand:- start:590 stop:1003 length:414 start_codon:yes stop_codon:yes gene_type:complete